MKTYEYVCGIIGVVIWVLIGLTTGSVLIQVLGMMVTFGPMAYETHKLFKEIDEYHKSRK